MTTHPEQTPLPLPPIDDDSVSEYLREHPDFFIRNARQVEQMVIPHPVKGSVSLVEWQLTRQRQQIINLEQEITLLMEQAQANQHLFGQLLYLQSHLATAKDLAELQGRLHYWAKSLGLAGASFRLFTDSWQLAAPSGFHHLGLERHTFTPFQLQRLGQDTHYLGRLQGPELLLLLPEAKAIGSVALSLLIDEGQEVGVLIFSSRNKDHYHPGMGTELLDCIAGFLPSLLTRWMSRS
ncbi:DUF484 domain-containing protein [Tatumella sp. TA1]|uniref:DUF484 domain-containing protein n=1 Tax=Rosenbergiella collisarenosi TaxID=1544695 RepID=UPI0008F95CAE|nr:DUF484 domain-containing protein [Rosenbergiella collisarenosi]MBT0721925.1 DUF484 domain-containing protein [Rosenbergiella collisarenosi]QGX92745.1 DUF484 domain-containing protein [Tatumella sp. TA1]